MCLVKLPGLGRDPGIRNFARGRNIAGWIFRSISLVKFEVDRVREVIEFFRLPGTKSLAIVANVQPIAGRLNLLRKSERISSQIEGLGGENSRRLMVLMILSDNVVRHPRKNDLWPGQANQANDFVQRFTVSPLF